MKKITNNMITGECYGITQQVIEGLTTGKDVKLTVSQNLGGTNNHRRYVITGNESDITQIISEYQSYLNS